MGKFWSKYLYFCEKYAGASRPSCLYFITVLSLTSGSISLEFMFWLLPTSHRGANCQLQTYYFCPCFDIGSTIKNLYQPTFREQCCNRCCLTKFPEFNPIRMIRVGFNCLVEGLKFTKWGGENRSEYLQGRRLCRNRDAFQPSRYHMALAISLIASTNFGRLVYVLIGSMSVESAHHLNSQVIKWLYV